MKSLFNQTLKRRCCSYLTGLDNDDAIVSELHEFRGNKVVFEEIINWVVDLERGIYLDFNRVRNLLRTCNFTQENGLRNGLERARKRGQALEHMLYCLVHEMTAKRERTEDKCRWVNRW